MTTKEIVDRLLSRREALGVIGAFGVTTLMGCGSSSSGAMTGTPTSTATGTATGSVTATATQAAATQTPSATASPTATRTTTATATPTSPAELSCVVSPDETEGPYFVDERLNRSDLTSDTTRPAVLNGLPLHLQLGVYVVSGDTCAPLAGARVDVWHADAAGVYSDEQVLNSQGETFLRGYQITDQNGAVEFQTIYPGWYPGRTVHIHFKVRTFSTTGSTSFEFTSQLYADDAITDVVFASAPYDSRGQRDTVNATDTIYNTPTAGTGAKLLLALQPMSSGSGFVGTFTIGLLTS